jgi:hypothetical protein
MFDLFPAYTKVTRAGLNAIPRIVLSMIHAGPGVSIRPTGDGGISIGADMQQAMEQMRSLTGGGSNGASDEVVTLVAALPAIPEAGYKKVRWGTSTDIEGGTATTMQAWEVCAGQTAWTPCQYYTTDSGVPPS